ncbi:GNAT family N-acetyltransferase [Rubellimicrobium aerolatum]|uniref:GNAT family N-acetyltransferase n=1 Tax=Rubellimicrobium aerolatum TaxID=490979 RepID=A0ABW0S8W7_9RHOB|nr:GNAT family N-acetyltransferase [Rubellimicrobium aerolatum]MBP1804742.1 RimJ/RimL family protein N-acetyltransferase [Rubellimicrobium aerolatum]
MTAFDLAPTLESPALRLRPLAASDRDALHAAASDPGTWAGHPARDRHLRAAFDPYFDVLLKAGGTLAVIDRASNRIIGASRFYVPPDRPESIAIGFTFLDRAHWGGAVNREMKRLMLAHAFQTFPEVWFHIAPTNLRSRRATAKLGALHDHDAVLDLAGMPAEWTCWRLTRAAWEANDDAARAVPAR